MAETAQFPRFVIYRIPMSITVEPFEFTWRVVHYYKNDAQAIDFSTGFDSATECWDFVSKYN